jgi:hypothetical protein
MATFEEYLASVGDDAERDALAHAWEVASAAAPDAVEVEGGGRRVTSSG